MNSKQTFEEETTSPSLIIKEIFESGEENQINDINVIGDSVFKAYGNERKWLLWNLEGKRESQRVSIKGVQL